jgi:hypothetical protein
MRPKLAAERRQGLAKAVPTLLLSAVIANQPVKRRPLRATIRLRGRIREERFAVVVNQAEGLLSLAINRTDQFQAPVYRVCTVV